MVRIRPRSDRAKGQAIDASWFRRRLLAWSDANRRRFLWRRRRVNPWQVLVSEFFLRKTGAEKVDATVRELLRRAPTPAALAAMPRHQLLTLIRPLGLQNIRARALKEIAETLVRDHGGRVPRDAAALRALPHVGRYMVNAVRTVGFRDPQPVVDANIMRILHRVLELPLAVEVHKADHLWEAARHLMPRRSVERGVQFNWALVDLGALVCTARAPRCPVCPLRARCAFAQRHRSATGCPQSRIPRSGSARSA